MQAWIFVMISGQMWNNIRGPPFAHKNPQTGEMVGLEYKNFVCVYNITLCIYMYMYTYTSRCIHLSLQFV